MRFNFTLSSKKMAFVLSLAFTLFSVQATWAQKAYIPNLGDNTVSVIDLTTDMVTTTVSVGTAPLCVAISTATNKVYIGNRDSNNLSVINPTTDEVEATIDIGGNVRGIAVNSAGTKAYVGDLTNDALKVIDLSTSTIEATIPLNGDAIDVAISPDDTKVLVANGNELAIINTATNAVETNINMAFPYEIAFNPAGTKAYVVEVFGDRVLEVDIATNTSSTLLSGINGAEGISITPDGSTLYVATSGVEVVDIATAMVTASITVGIDPESMQVDALGQKAYAVNYGSDNVSVIDIATNTVEATIAVGGSPLAIGDFLLEELLIPGDLCTTASDINSLFGGQTDVPQTSGLYNNNDATTDAFDPDFGWECFGEPSGGGENPELNRTLWFSFTGDGNTYSITTVECNSSDYIDSGDTQMALYSGSDCNNLSAEDCNDDFDSDNVLFQAYLELTTEMGVEYFLMIDGFGGSFPADGEFCIEVTQLPESSTKDLPQSKIRLFPNPTTGLLYLDQLDVERIEVYNEQSQLVFAQNQSTQQIDVSHLPAGMYFVKGIGAARIYTGRVVKE